MYALRIFSNFSIENYCWVGANAGNKTHNIARLNTTQSQRTVLKKGFRKIVDL
jgi:hypothetical protein